jgi:hypothetical protein
MGNRAQQLGDQGKTVLFAFEEAIGKKQSWGLQCVYVCVCVCVCVC